MKNRDVMAKCIRAIRSSITPEQNETAKQYCILAMRKIYGHEIFPNISNLARDLEINKNNE